MAEKTIGSVRGFILTTLVAVIVLMGFGSPFAHAETIVDGDLISTADNPDIFIVKLVGVKKFKRLILNPKIFESYVHLRWEDVKTVPQASVDQYITSDLVREVNADGSAADPKVYRIIAVANSDVGERRWLNMTASEFAAGGLDWDSLYFVNHTEAGPSFYPTREELNYAELLQERRVFQPGSLVISEDTLIKRAMVLRPGDSIEFRNGARLAFGVGGYADWQGTPTSTWSDDGLTQNLVRDIKIFGSGDIRFQAGSGKSTIKFVEIDLQPKQELGAYPLHWHFAGDGSVGTWVEGVVIKNSTNRAFVPHASHGITFKDTIAKNIQGDAYWWDPPEFQSKDTINNSHDILYDHALADGISNLFSDNRGYRLSAFKLGSGENNTVRNSVARNVVPSHPKNCSGFKWPEEQGQVWTFENSASFGSACNGIFVWQNNGSQHIVDGFRGDGIEHGAYKNRYDYKNVNVDFVVVHALGWTIDGGSIGEVSVRRHTLEGDPVVFSNLTIGSFVINNTGNSGHLAGTYVLNNTNLLCGDIVYQGVVPGTSVIIDGLTC